MAQNAKDQFHVYVVGAIQGEFPIEEGRMTLIQLLSLAGGLPDGAGPTEIRIIRAAKRGGKFTIQVDYDALISRQIDDVVLFPDDVVYVPEGR
jgi:protein involved in polysaccharide export with SLBB domain